MINIGGGRWQCTDCPYLSNKSYSMKRHIESKHVPPMEYTCQFCEKVVVGRSSYDNHTFRCSKMNRT